MRSEVWHSPRVRACMPAVYYMAPEIANQILNGSGGFYNKSYTQSVKNEPARVTINPCLLLPRTIARIGGYLESGSAAVHAVDGHNSLPRVMDAAHITLETTHSPQP